MTVGAARAATTRNPMGPEREVLGFIVNIRFKICRPVMMRAAIDVLCVIFAERLGSGTAFAAAGRPVERTRAVAIPAERSGGPGRPVRTEDREWLHRPQIP
jgi:hypothetical protein